MFLIHLQSRLSPFANKSRREKLKPTEMLQFKDGNISKTSISQKFQRWFTLIDAATLSRKQLLLTVKEFKLLNSELHRTLYGFIVFEVAWKDVRGINYLNELQVLLPLHHAHKLFAVFNRSYSGPYSECFCCNFQTDTSLAIEAKFMKRWEFDSIDQAAESISSWFPGPHSDQHILKDYLYSATGILLRSHYFYIYWKMLQLILQGHILQFQLNKAEIMQIKVKISQI